MATSPKRMNDVFASLAVISLLTITGTVSRGQGSGHGSISGTVTANQGTVRAFRVKARDVAHGVTYMVYTKSGRYKVPELVPSTYEVRVFEDAYESPVQTVDLSGGENKGNVDVSLKMKPPRQGLPAEDFDTLYPPSPARTLLMMACFGCHGRDSFNRIQRNEAGWRFGLNRMINGPFLGGNSPILQRSRLTAADKDMLVKYLAANFNPDRPIRILKLDDFQRDENALADAIFVEYDAPPNLPGARTPQATLHDPYVVPDGTVWYGMPSSSATEHLAPTELDPVKRWKVFPVGGGAHGATVDREGRVYWAEIGGGRLGELDPKTGKSERHTTPTLGELLQVIVDKDDNVWYAGYGGSTIGKLDAETRQISQWATPTVDVAPYGLASDQKGNIWVAGPAANMAIKFDPVTETFTEYKTPTQPSGVRRIGVDSKGIVWFSEYTASQFGSLDPATGKITEYKFPLRYTHPYETWPDNDDHVYSTDSYYNSIIQFDRKTSKFTYYPYPQGPRWAVPKIEIDADNTVWFGSRPGCGDNCLKSPGGGATGEIHNYHGEAVHFYPHGYTDTQKPRF